MKVGRASDFGALTAYAVAGTRRVPDSREFANSAELMKRGRAPGALRRNTTLAVVATNAKFDKVRAGRVAQQGQHGFVRAISPVHTSMDGDLCIALSCGDLPASVDAVGVAAGEAVAAAIVRAVKSARTLGGVPGLAGD